MTPLDDDFTLRVGRIGHDKSVRLSVVKGAIGRAQSRGRGPSQAGSNGATSGVRPHVKPRAGPKTVQGFSGANRRVVIKARIVPHGANGGGKLKAHVGYLAREGQAKAAQRGLNLGVEVTQAEPAIERQIDYLAQDEGQTRARFYDAGQTALDAKALTASWAQDLRHFRFIVSPEDGAALGDLKPFVRELMANLQQRLGTKLEWVAADHWDTDNPHSHVLVRGRRADGRDLVIPRKIISHEMRERAQKIVTRILGPRPVLGHELERQRQELAAPRLTAIDREILSQTSHGFYAPSLRRPDILARLRQLETWSFAAQQADGRWTIAPNLATNLKALGERQEVRQILARVEDLTLADYDILSADPKQPVLGRLVRTAVLDELSDRVTVVLENAEGQLIYAGFKRQADLALLEGAVPGALLALEPTTPTIRPSDEIVARIADVSDGLYSEERHLRLEPRADPALIAGNIRRLEAMRRANLVERQPDGSFVIAEDHLRRVLRYEERQVQRAPLQVKAASYWTLGEQERAHGLTQLDRVLSGTESAPKGAGRFAKDFEASLQRRRLSLIEQGYLGSQEITLSQNAVRRLALLELDRTMQNLEKDLGRPVYSHHVARIEGVYARRIDLAQGRYALIVQKDSVHLVEWRPALERFAGHRVQGIARGRSIAWSLAKMRAPDLPGM